MDINIDSHGDNLMSVTIAQYHELVATGILDERRVELLPTFRTSTFTTCIGHEDSTV